MVSIKYSKANEKQQQKAVKISKELAKQKQKQRKNKNRSKNKNKNKINRSKNSSRFNIDYLPTKRDRRTTTPKRKKIDLSTIETYNTIYLQFILKNEFPDKMGLLTGNPIVPVIRKGHTVFDVLTITDNFFSPDTDNTYRLTINPKVKRFIDFLKDHPDKGYFRLLAYEEGSGRKIASIDAIDGEITIVCSNNGRELFAVKQDTLGRALVKSNKSLVLVNVLAEPEDESLLITIVKYSLREDKDKGLVLIRRPLYQQSFKQPIDESVIEKGLPLVYQHFYLPIMTAIDRLTDTALVTKDNDSSSFFLTPYYIRNDYFSKEGE